MERRRFHAKSLVLTALLIGLATFSLMPMLATAAGSQTPQYRNNKAIAKATISMSSKGIVATPSSLNGGYYLLTIRNNTSKPRGVEMIGIDKALSPTLRYTKILRPGKSEAFRWYFAKSKTVYVRDITSRTHVKTGFTTVTFGLMRKAIEVY